MTVLIGGASTQSRGRRPLPASAGWSYPITTRVDGAYEYVSFWDSNSNHAVKKFLSWVVGQGGLLWGGSPPDSIAGLKLPVAAGSYGYDSEYVLASTLGDLFSQSENPILPNEVGVRFAKNGSDVCAMAVRLARAITGREAIASCGYHGHSDSLAHAPNHKGLPQATLDLHHRFEFGDVAGMKKAADGAACVMVEVPANDDEDYLREFLFECQSLCNDTGALFIMDEVVTGFRFGLRGASGLYDLNPDFICLGKAMSAVGGISALVGRYEFMRLLESEVFYSGTFFGAPADCDVAIRTIEYLKENEEDVYAHLYTIGQALKDGLNKVFSGRGIKALAIGNPTRSSLVFEDGELARREWCSKMIAEGVILDRPQFPTLAHTMREVEFTIECARKVAV